MEQIRLIDTGLVTAVRSQTVYHAVARAHGSDTPNTIILTSPAEPYVCIGYHQDLEQEVDLDYCAAHRLPVYRREVGGGAVYLDRDQLFTQWVFAPRSLPRDLNDQFGLYIDPLVATYRAFGIDAYLRPVNDVHVGGKKIGGTGAAQIEDARVLVGSLMFGFDKETMSKVLKVPSEKMRDKVFESLNEYMTTMSELLDPMPSRDEVVGRYLEECARVLDAEIVPGEMTETESALAERLDSEFGGDAWLRQKGRVLNPGVKIHQDVRIVESVHKAPGGLVRVTARLNDGRIERAEFSGDFTMLPSDGITAIEKALLGASLDRDQLVRLVKGSYDDLELESPGIEPLDFVQPLLQAAGP